MFRISTKEPLKSSTTKIYRKVYELVCGTTCYTSNCSYDEEESVMVMSFACNPQTPKCNRELVLKMMNMIPSNVHYLSTSSLAEKINIDVGKHPELPIWWTYKEFDIGDSDISRIAANNGFIMMPDGNITCIRGLSLIDLFKTPHKVVPTMLQKSNTEALKFTMDVYISLTDDAKHDLGDLTYMNVINLMYGISIREWLSKRGISSIVIPDLDNKTAFVGTKSSELDNLNKIRIMTNDYEELNLNLVQITSDSLGWTGYNLVFSCPDECSHDADDH